MNVSRVAFVLTELRADKNGITVISGTSVFTDRAAAVKFLHSRYLDARLEADVAGGESRADYSDRGWYEVVFADGTAARGVVSEGEVVDAHI